MIGYVIPDKGELKVSEYELYRAAYCGLCHALKKRCGFGARMALSYDLCFFAMLLCGARGEKMAVCRKRCPVSPFRRKTCIIVFGKKVIYKKEPCRNYEFLTGLL